MRTFLKTFVILFTVFFFGSCDNGIEEITPGTLEVTPNNISGVWKLMEFNGLTMPDSAYCYIEYIRKDKKFVMYQKFDSMYPRRITGTYSIENDAKKGAILSGKYDFGMGEWNNKYIVSELYEDGMLLIAESGEEISRYMRCNEVPSEIFDMAK